MQSTWIPTAIASASSPTQLKLRMLARAAATLDSWKLLRSSKAAIKKHVQEQVLTPCARTAPSASVQGEAVTCPRTAMICRTTRERSRPAVKALWRKSAVGACPYAPLPRLHPTHLCQFALRSPVRVHVCVRVRACACVRVRVRVRVREMTGCDQRGSRRQSHQQALRPEAELLQDRWPACSHPVQLEVASQQQGCHWKARSRASSQAVRQDSTRRDLLTDGDDLQSNSRAESAGCEGSVAETSSGFLPLPLSYCPCALLPRLHPTFTGVSVTLPDPAPLGSTV